MRKQLLLLSSLITLFISGTFAQTPLLTESFETDGEGDRYTSNTFFTGCSDLFSRADNTGPSCLTNNPTNINGTSYWTGEDCDVATGGTGVLTFNAVVATGYEVQLDVLLAIARPSDGRFEPDDELLFQYNMDGGGWTTFAAFYGSNDAVLPNTDPNYGNLCRDVDLDGSYDIPVLQAIGSSDFSDWNFSVPVTGNSLQVRFIMGQNQGGGEEVLVDNIRITGTVAVPSPGAWDGSASTDWNVASNWTGNVVPTASDDITIPSAPSNQPHVTLAPGTPAVCNNITVESGATLTIDAGKALTVSGDTDNSGTIIVKASASGIGSFMDNGTITGSGSFQMEQYLTGSGGATPDGLFYYVSSPISDATAANYNVAGGNKLWIDDEPNQTYPQLTFGAIPLEVGQGYIARMGSNTTVAFNGSSYNTGNITEGSLTRTGTTELNRGYNLVGNPYPSTVSWDDASRTNLETTMYYRTHNGSTMLFDTYNATGSVGTSNNGTTVTGDVPPGQGFWVRVPTDGQTGSITFENADRSHGTLSSIYKAAAEEGMLRLTLSDGTISDEQIILFKPAAQSVYDDYDSQKFWAADVPQLYSTIATDTLTINGLNNPIATPTVPLGMKVPAQGAYTINATSITFTETPVYLEDTELNNFQNLNTTPTYAFNSDAGNIGDRFVLHFSEVTGIDETENNISVYSSNNQVHINLSNPSTGTITVLDMSGRTVHTQNITTDRTVIDLKTAQGIYVVKVETAEQTISKKLSIQ